MTHEYGEGPSSEPWQPQRYEPAEHQRRLHQPVQSYGPPPWPPQQPSPRRSWPARHKVLTGLGAVAIIIIIASIAAAAGKPSKPTAAPNPPAANIAAPVTQAANPDPVTPVAHSAAKAKRQPQTVTYVVTGSDADVTYGPAGSDLSGSVPMHLTRPLGSPLYYSVTAQLQGGGSVSCKLEIDGRLISQSTASGGYNIADCEIDQNPFTGGWEDTNASG